MLRRHRVAPIQRRVDHALPTASSGRLEVAFRIAFRSLRWEGWFARPRAAFTNFWIGPNACFFAQAIARKDTQRNRMGPVGAEGLGRDSAPLRHRRQAS